MMMFILLREMLQRAADMGKRGKRKKKTWPDGDDVIDAKVVEPASFKDLKMPEAIDAPRLNEEEETVS